MTSSLLYKTTNTTLPPQRTRPVWPDAVALREALQHPATTLPAELELNRAVVAVGRDGLPLVYTGRFAAVFRLNLPGNIPVALRVFTAPDSSLAGDRNVRTERIANALERTAAQVGDILPPPLFLFQGVRIGDTWYPAQILPWVQGMTLLPFVDAHRHQPEALRALASTVQSTVDRLEAAGIAHGDLQHDNLLVQEGGKSVTLVDYDGISVSEVSHFAPPAERGHPNYQHPARTREQSGPGIDRFAATVIGTGLLLLAQEPELWERFDGGMGEGMLFTAADFAAPAVSPLFAEARIQAKKDSFLAEMLHRLEVLCGLEAPPLLSTATAIEGAVQTVERPLKSAWPSRVSPTCDEERIRSVSYLKPLRLPLLTARETSNFAALRLYLLLAPPLVILAWNAAWEAGGAKWPFLAYLFALCMGLLFTALYLAWPVKRQWDALQLEKAKLEEEQRLAEVRLVVLQREREALQASPPPGPDQHLERSYIADAFSRVPISRAIDAVGIAPETVRTLRRNGIETAAQLWLRHPILTFSAGVAPSEMALLRTWIRDGEAFHAERFLQETSPMYAIESEIVRLETAVRQRTVRLRELTCEASRFPEASKRAYFRGAFSALLPYRAGNRTPCRE